MSPGFFEKRRQEKEQKNILDLLNQAESFKSLDPSLGRSFYEQAKSLYEQLGYQHTEICRRVNDIYILYHMGDSSKKQ